MYGTHARHRNSLSEWTRSPKVRYKQLSCWSNTKYTAELEFSSSAFFFDCSIFRSAAGRDAELEFIMLTRGMRDSTLNTFIPKHFLMVYVRAPWILPADGGFIAISKRTVGQLWKHYLIVSPLDTWTFSIETTENAITNQIVSGDSQMAKYSTFCRYSDKMIENCW